MDWNQAINLATIAELVLRLKAFVRAFSERRTKAKQQSERDYESTLKALLKALNETQIYIGTKKTNKKTEAKLSRLWTRAAVKIRNYDIDLAERCQMKGVYWTDPKSWDDQDIEKTRIGISEVADTIKKLL